MCSRSKDRKAPTGPWRGWRSFAAKAASGAEPGTGVLVKAAKLGQDQRIDLPVIGPSTVEAAAAAGLAGVAVVAGSTIVAEPERIAAAADRARIFVVGVDAETER